MTLQEIDTKIKEVKEAIKNVQGTECEVYARIVGYYRAVQHWNKGKRCEFDERLLFDKNVPKIKDTVKDVITNNKSDDVKVDVNIDLDSSKDITLKNTFNKNSLRYMLFTKPFCPNCPPVKEYISSIKMDGVNVDCATDSGILEATKYGVFSTPTVIFYEGEKEVRRVHTVDELQEVVNM